MDMLVLILEAMASVQPPAATPPQVRGASERQVAAQTTTPMIHNTGTGRDRMICRRQARTGTLSGFETICHTAAEWQALSRGTGQTWQQLQGTFGSSNCARTPRQDGPAC